MSPGLTILVPLPVLLVLLSPSHSSLYLSGIFRCLSILFTTSGIFYSASTTTTYFSTFTTSSYLSTTSLSSTIIVASFP